MALPKAKDFQEALADNSADWYKIALQWDVDHDEVKRIRVAFLNDAKMCLPEMIESRLRVNDPPASWENLAAVLKTKSVNLPRLAGEIEKEHVRRSTTVGPPPAGQVNRRENLSTKPSLTEREAPTPATENSEKDEENVDLSLSVKHDHPANKDLPLSVKHDQPANKDVVGSGAGAKAGACANDHMECFLIGSFGPLDVEDSTRVHIKPRRAAATLPAVGNDLDKIQDRMEDDDTKHLWRVHASIGRNDSQYILGKMTALFTACKGKCGVLLWYAGHGVRGTGDWAFSGDDDIITFEKIMTLYETHFAGNLLYIVTDCCFSGYWVHECARWLDERRVAQCGHDAIAKGYRLKIFASCRHDEEAGDGTFVEKGITYKGGEKTLSFWHADVLRQGSYTQQTLCVDFTEKSEKCHSVTPEGCTVGKQAARENENWKTYVNNMAGEKQRRVYN